MKALGTESKFDTYNFKARLAPFILVIMPIVLAVSVWLSFTSDPWDMLGSIGVTSALSFLMIQLGRDQGLWKQTDLLASWGGSSTTRFMRHRDKSLDPHTKARYHEKLQSLLPSIKMPNAKAEKRNPVAADQVYESCTRFLREATRDKKSYPLVYEANVDYGFRRNLWGMKPSGIVLALLGTFGCIANVLYVSRETYHISAFPIGATVICGLILTWWIFRINREWVKLSSDAYAERLLAACDTLQNGEETIRNNAASTRN